MITRRISRAAPGRARGRRGDPPIDPRDQYFALYQDDRGVCRLFGMTFDGEHWTLTREDPDFHQRFVADLEPDRIRGRWEASDDQGTTWRKDVDLTFERT